MNENIISKIRDFNRFYTNITGLINNHILESDYSLTEVRIMFEIYYNPTITARKIMETIQVDEGYLSRLISSLIKRKIVIRKKSKEDGRVYALALSAKGEKIFLQLNQRSSDKVTETIAHLTKDQQKELISLMERVKKLLIKN